MSDSTIGQVSLEVDDVLAAADQLAADGRFRAAIDLLVATASRDGRVERRLVELRHEGFAELADQRSRPDWPRVVDDPFPDVAGVPECRPDELTGDVIAGAIAHHGSLIVRGLLDPGRARLMHDDIERTFAARAAAEGSPEADGRWYAPFEPGFAKASGFGAENFVRAADSPASFVDLLDVFEHTGVPAMIAEHLGEPPVLSASKCALRRVTAQGEPMDFHQDGNFLGEGIRVVNVWTALTPCGGEHPAAGLDIVPRRIPTVLETGEGIGFFDWTVPPDRAIELAGEQGLTNVAFEPGDAVLFDELCLHRTGSRPTTTESRTAIEMWYFAPSTYPGNHVPLVV